MARLAPWLVQRFGSALNLNVHFHMLFVDGVYLADGTDPPVFRHVAGPGLSELQTLVEQISEIDVRWAPPEQPASPSTRYWLFIRLQSPSNGARRNVTVGGPYDGDVEDTPPPRNPADIAIEKPLAEFKVDLPAVMDLIQSGGLLARLSDLRLRMVGAAGTVPLAAWTISSRASPKLFPAALDAQTGLLIPWQRAYNPPPTDAEIRAARDRLLNRNQPVPGNVSGVPDYLRCFWEVQQSGMCAH